MLLSFTCLLVLSTPATAQACFSKLLYHHLLLLITPARLQAFYKAQADLVIKTQASLNDSQKMIAELFDNKLRGFGAVPILQYYFQFNWDLYQLVVFDAHAHAVGH
jgi:hypothetical protein